MNIEIMVGDQVVNAHLADNPSAQDFAAMLPLELSLEDYGKIEKVADLPKKLTKDGAPAGYKPAPGDITYYAPWGNLAIFLRGFSYSAGLIYLGKIDSGLEKLVREGALKVVIRMKAEDSDKDGQD
ncbi:cyclophilin-like fold protein [Ruficoccus sp. ZRK36]|uniref:cyclophilin-like fold protein n=1 Tax=Ruficoccus sp. ZRK36 TaxID=2866311 RepID=UPI001C73CCE2|nr:cyclophilin-like fold protein [Ruficoccus sp. ZRK36]QYY35038.1 hypothetical protein K0V07_12095 [Ruficoccus sp. ZRK36]